MVLLAAFLGWMFDGLEQGVMPLVARPALQDLLHVEDDRRIGLWLPLYLPELFPTRVRATGQGLCYNSGRIFAVGGALQMGRLLKQFEGSYARAGANIKLIYVLGMVLIWLAPETKGKLLPE
jgi:hypothetical protein